MPVSATAQKTSGGNESERYLSTDCVRIRRNSDTPRVTRKRISAYTEGRDPKIYQAGARSHRNFFEPHGTYRAFSCSPAVLEAFPETSYFAVLESRDAFRLRPQGMEWFTIHHALTNLLFAGDERRAVKSSYQKAVSRTLVDSREPFCRVGWMLELQDWVDSIIRLLGMELKSFEQVRMAARRFP